MGKTNDNALLIKRYKNYISVLEAANKEQENVILIQDNQIEVLNQLNACKDEHIAALTEQMEQVLSCSKALLGFMDDAENTK